MTNVDWGNVWRKILGFSLIKLRFTKKKMNVYSSAKLNEKRKKNVPTHLECWRVIRRLHLADFNGNKKHTPSHHVNLFKKNMYRHHFCESHVNLWVKMIAHTTSIVNAWLRIKIQIPNSGFFSFTRRKKRWPT